MKNKLLGKIFCIVLGLCFLVPMSVLITENAKSDGETKGEVYCWREGESWDWSWDVNSSKNWVIETIGAVAESASDDIYTDVINVQNSGDYVRWDFYVNESDTYKFWIRGYHTIAYQGGCDDVRLYWETGSSSSQIGSLQNWHNMGGWTWTTFGNKTLDNGIGTLVIRSYDSGWLGVDKILITNNYTYTPMNEGNEIGSISHVIGDPITMYPGNEITDLDEEYIENNAWELSDINDFVDWNADGGYGIPMGRFFGTPGESRAAYYLETRLKMLGLHTYSEPIAAYPDYCIDDIVEVHSKGLNYTLTSGGPIKTVNEFFIGPRYNLSYLYWLQNYIKWDFETWDTLTYNCSHSNLKIRDRMNWPHTFNASFDDVIEAFLDEYQDDILSDVETYIAGRESTCFNDTFDFMMNVTYHYFEVYQNFSFEEYDPLDSNTYPLFFNDEYIPACIDSDFIFIEEDPWNNPDVSKLSFFREGGLTNFSNRFTYYGFLTLFHLPTRCKGFVLYDFNNDCHNMVNTRYMALPLLFINGTVGDDIMNNGTSDARINFWVDQYYNHSVESYNVIGTIYGEDPSKTVILSSLYDSWWSNGTTDSAIGMSIVTGIAKYFKENNIIPKYTLKFIGFGGEECGFIGALNYAQRHKDEDIIAIIDLNQLGFEERTDINLTFTVTMNEDKNDSFADEIIDRTNYNETGDQTSQLKYAIDKKGAESNDHEFTDFANCQTVSLLKDTGWTLHHRSGQNYLEGDVFKYYNPQYVRVCAEMALNLTLAYSCPNLPVLISPLNNSNFIIDSDKETTTVVLTAVASTQNNEDIYYRFYNASTNGLIYATSAKPSGTPVSCNWGSLGTGTHSWYVRAAPSNPAMVPRSVTRTFVCLLLDVNQSVKDRGYPIHRADTEYWGAAQNFTPTVDTITNVELYIRRMGESEFDLTVELREDGVEGTLLDTVVIPRENVPETWTWFSIDFNDSTVGTGSDIFIVVPPPSGVTTSFGYEWGYAFGDLYSGGAFWFTRDGGTLWRELPDTYDFTFKTYGYT